MIRKPNSSDAKRLGTGVLVAGMAAAGAVALASPASAAASAINASPAQQNYPTGQQATINVTTTGTPTSLMFRITAGPDKTTGTTGTACSPANESPSTCTFTNGGTAGTDTVQVFDDADGSGTYNSGETQTTTTVNFTGNPTSVTLSPSNGGSVSAGNPATFTVSASDANNNPAVGKTVTISSTETNKSPNSTITYSDADGGDRSTTANNGPDGSGNYTHTATETVTTDKNGQATVKVTSDTAGSVSVIASYSSSVQSAASTFTVTGGQTGNNAVTKIAASPKTQNAGTNGTASVTVTATDGSNPVGGVTISYEITSGPDKTAAGTYPTCSGTTSQTTGQVTCTIPSANNTAAGTDNIEFFVNQTVAGTQQTPGPDSTEPTDTAAVTFVAQPEYDNITLTTPDQSTNDDNTDATVPVGTASSTFTATVEDENAAGTSESPVSGAVVNFTVDQVMPDGTTVALNPTSGTTNANGVATTTATPSTTTAGTTYRVTAIVGNGSSYRDDGNGNGDSASATVTYEASAAQAPVLTPKNQSATIGGSATVTATVDDQFGAPKSGITVRFAVTGRNDGQAQNIVTNSSGQSVFTYSDAPTGNGTTDTVTATTSAGSDTATVYWITGSTTPATASLALQGDNLGDNCNSPNSDGTTEQCFIGSASDTNYADDALVTVKNSSGQALAGVSVTFTASQPFVGDGSNAASDFAAGSTTYTATTDSNGQATVYAGSTKSGDQVITAAAGGAQSNQATITYVAEDPSVITLTPTTATIAKGGSQKYTALVQDEYGNPVVNDEIAFSQNGPGTLNNTFGYTGVDGTASVLLSVASTGASGTGTVSATDNGFFGGSARMASSTYTVPAGGVTTDISAYLASSPKVGQTTYFASSVATDSTGAPVSGVTLNFGITGSTATSGTAVTDSNGRAKFMFTPQHAGGMKLTVTDPGDSNVDPATATATTAKANDTTKLAQGSAHKGQLVDTAYTSIKMAGIRVDFYQVLASGRNKFVKSQTTDANGRAQIVLNGIKSGYVYKGLAKVSGANADYDGPSSAVVTTKIK